MATGVNNTLEAATDTVGPVVVIGVGSSASEAIGKTSVICLPNSVTDIVVCSFSCMLWKKKIGLRLKWPKLRVYCFVENTK